MPQVGQSELEGRLTAMVTLRALRREAPDARAAERDLAGLSEMALAFAAQNMDHSERGRDMARRALAARVGEAEADRRIEAFIDETPSPGWVGAGDVAKGDAIFFGWRPWAMRGLLVLALASVALWFGLVWDADNRERAAFDTAVAAGVLKPAEVEEAYREPPANSGDPTALTKKQALRERPDVAPYFAEYQRRSELSGNAGLWSMFLFPLYTILLGWRLKPARVLLLRRFNDPEIGKSIEKMSRRWLKPYGHVFTLADKHFRRSRLAPLVSWFSFNPFLLLWRVVNIPVSFVIRLTDRSRAGPILVWNARDFRNFARRLIDRYGLNLEMERTQRRTIAVRTSDKWWQHVVTMLMHAADVVVVDVTEVAGGTVWELETVLRERVGERVVFVAREDRAQEATASLAQHGFPGREPVLYRANGSLRENRAFREQMRQAISRKLSDAA